MRKKKNIRERKQENKKSKKHKNFDVFREKQSHHVCSPVSKRDSNPLLEREKKYD